MKYVFLTFFSLLAGMALSAQTGTAFGIITDAATGEALPGATVVAMSNGRGTITELTGEYRLPNLPVGTQQLQISYIGYQTDTLEVDVPAGGTVNANAKLLLNATVLGEVVVRSQLEGQKKALNQQRSADNIINVISADLIGRFPDLNVAEALQRVPGVNISRSRGEGSTVSLRGTPTHFTTININGEQLPSTQSDGSRNESLDLIPADQLASMEITKAITPDMDGDAIGGTVNLRTPTATGMALKLKAEAGGGYNSMSQSYNGIGRFKAGRRFWEDEKLGTGRFGALIGLSYFETDNESDELEAVWSPFGDTPVLGLGRDTVVIENHQVSDLVNQRTRVGATLTLDYKFSPNSDIIFNFMYSRRGDVDERNRLRTFLNESAGVTWVSLDTIRGAELRRDIRLAESFSENLSYNLQGQHKLGRGTIDWGLYHADSRRVEDALNGRFERGEQNRVDLYTLNPSGIYADFAQFRTLGSELGFFDPFLITEINRYEQSSLHLDATNSVAKVNYELPYQIGSFPATFKTGFKYRRQTNIKAFDSDVNNFSDPNRVIDQAEGFASVISDFEDENFLGGNVRFGPGIDPGKYREFVDRNDNLFIFDQIRSNRNSFNASYEASEDIIAGYAMTRIQFRDLMVLGGLRYETNEVNYDAFSVNNITGDATPITDGTNYSFLLPNIHLKYSLGKFTNLRAAATWSYARANFDDIVPFLNIDEEGSRIQAGNPDLRPGSALNLDLLAERYLGNVGIISGGLFYKQIDDFQFSRNLRFLRPGDPFYDEFPGFQFRQEQNGETAVVYGFEMNVQAALSFLPKPLDGLGLFFNYTFTESDAFTSDRDNISLPGQAAHTWNTALSYDYKQFSVKGSLNYNGTFLNTVAGEARNDLVQEGRLQVDLNGSVAVTDRITLFGEFLNVTNAPVLVYQGIRERIAQYEIVGWWNRFGLSYRL
jgi:TonB-dependent receptor